MVTATLWIEITMAGFVYLLGFCFFFLPTNPKADLSTVLSYKDILPYVSVAIVGCSYIIGVIFHRVVQASVRFLTGRIKTGRLHGWIAQHSGRRSSAPLAEIWQFGSPRLHREVDFHFGLLALLRSLLFSVPILAISSTTWAARSGVGNPLPMAGMYCLAWALCYVAHHRQVHLYRRIQDYAVKVCVLVRSSQSKTDSLSPSDHNQ